MIRRELPLTKNDRKLDSQEALRKVGSEAGLRRGLSPPSGGWLPAGNIIALVNVGRARCDGGRRGSSLAGHMARLRASAIGKI